MRAIGEAEQIVMGGVSQPTPYWQAVFETFAEAAKWQREKVDNECVIMKYAIHSTGIEPELDYETRAALFKVHLRLFPRVAR